MGGQYCKQLSIDCYLQNSNAPSRPSELSIFGKYRVLDKLSVLNISLGCTVTNRSTAPTKRLTILNV